MCKYTNQILTCLALYLDKFEESVNATHVGIGVLRLVLVDLLYELFDKLIASLDGIVNILHLLGKVGVLFQFNKFVINFTNLEEEVSLLLMGRDYDLLTV